MSEPVRKTFNAKVDEKLTEEFREVARSKGMKIYSALEEAMRLWIDRTIAEDRRKFK